MVRAGRDIWRDRAANPLLHHAFATLRGITAVLRVSTVEKVFVELPAGQDLPSFWSAGLAVSTPTALALRTAVALLLMIWVLRRSEGRSIEVWLGGCRHRRHLVGLGKPGLWPEDPNTLEPAFLATNSRRMESLSMVAPVGYALDWLPFFSDKVRC